MRQIVLDTETTGLDPTEGHRVIEIGCLEMTNRRPSGRSFHYYLQPDRAIDEGAQAVHGITAEHLAEAPRFADVAAEFIAFVRDAELIIHNAPFDLAFLNAELRLLGADWGTMDHYCTVLDTLTLARERHPGQRNSLDALCKRYGVDNSGRQFHGALLDAEILADVYLAMTGGQANLLLDCQPVGGDQAGGRRRASHTPRPPLRIIAPTEAERAAHAQRLSAIDAASGGKCIWLRLR